MATPLGAVLAEFGKKSRQSSAAITHYVERVLVITDEAKKVTASFNDARRSRAAQREPGSRRAKRSREPGPDGRAALGPPHPSLTFEEVTDRKTGVRYMSVGHIAQHPTKLVISESTESAAKIAADNRLMGTREGHPGWKLKKDHTKDKVKLVGAKMSVFACVVLDGFVGNGAKGLPYRIESQEDRKRKRRTRRKKDMTAGKQMELLREPLLTAMLRAAEYSRPFRTEHGFTLPEYERALYLAVTAVYNRFKQTKSRNKRKTGTVSGGVGKDGRDAADAEEGEERTDEDESGGE